MRHNFRSPCDRLRANGSAFWGSSSPAVHPSTGSGQTEAHFGDRLPRLFTLRQAQGERKRTLGIVFPGCSPFDRLRANGSGFIGDRLPWLFTLRQAQGERKRTLGIVFPGCAPFDRLRANGSALRGSSSPAVHPSTGSGRTEAHFGDRLPRLFTLRRAQGERIAHFGDRLPRLCTLRQAQGERKRTLGIVFPGCSPFDRLRANGLAHKGQSLPRQYTLRQRSARTEPSKRQRSMHSPVASPEKAPSQTSRRSPLWHCLRAL